MSEKLEVSFNSPQCGWMSIGFSGSGGEFHTTTAHAPHERALPELLQILTRLLDENSTGNEFVLHWNRNPEEFDFRFVRNNEKVLVEIYQYPTEERFAENREKVFAYEGKIAEICQSFYDTFAQLEADKNTDEFEQNWRQPFPLNDFEKFENKLRFYGK